MRFWVGLTVALLSASALTQETFPGAKPDVAAGPVPTNEGVSLMPLFQMAIVAGLILVFLKVWLPKVLGRIQRRLDARPGGGIRIEEAATFSAGTLYLAEVRGRTLLLCAATNGVTCLADLTEATSSEPEQAAFFEILDEKTAQNAPGRPNGRIESLPSEALNVQDVQAALDRARRLVV